MKGNILHYLPVISSPIHLSNTSELPETTLKCKLDVA